MTDTVITLTADEKRAVTTALTYAWNEVFDKGRDEEGRYVEPTGEALHLLTALAKLDPTYRHYLPSKTVKRRF